MRSVVLHVQEVRGQSALRGVWVRWRTLALPLVTSASLRLGARARRAGDQTIVVQRLGDATGDDAEIKVGGVAAQDSVGVVDVGAREVCDGRVKLRETDKDLLVAVIALAGSFSGRGGGLWSPADGAQVATRSVSGKHAQKCERIKREKRRSKMHMHMHTNIQERRWQQAEQGTAAR